MTNAQNTTLEIADTTVTVVRSAKRPTAAVTFGDADARRCGFLEEQHDPTPAQIETFRGLLAEVREWAAAEGLISVEVYMSQEGAQDVMVQSLDIDVAH